MEKKPSDLLTLQKNLDIDLSTLANELYNLMQAGYVRKVNNLLYLADRGREYLRVEKGEAT